MLHDGSFGLPPRSGFLLTFWSGRGLIEDGLFDGGLFDNGLFDNGLFDGGIFDGRCFRRDRDDRFRHYIGDGFLEIVMEIFAELLGEEQVEVLENGFSYLFDGKIRIRLKFFPKDVIVPDAFCKFLEN
jgi:hypothetical protein